MKVLGLDGKFHVWNLTGHRVLGDDVRPRSQLHLDARRIIKSIWPTEPLLEELHLPGSFGLFADFFLPNRKMMVECHGEQHYKFVSHFHQDMNGFLRSRHRDENKSQWCKLNNFNLIELPYSESEEQWRLRLMTL